MSIIPDDILKLAEQVLQNCRERGLSIAAAESCTGGLVMAALTEIAGSSVVVDRGFVTYSNAAKTDMLGVPGDLIEMHGAVSEPVAKAMADGALVRSGVSLAVAITGIAGPGGGSASKPVGLVHVCAASALAHQHKEFRFGPIGRTQIRISATRAALEMLNVLALQSLE